MPCKTCTSEFICTSCYIPYYFEPPACISSDQCPYGTYPDKNTYTCKKCDRSCLGCYGPENSNCVSCNYPEAYTKVNGRCQLFVCKSGMFLDIDRETKVAECKSCHESCKSCVGETKDDCIYCSDGYASFRKPSTDLVNCLRCEEYLKGYYTGKDGSCKGNLSVNFRNMWRRSEFR